MSDMESWIEFGRVHDTDFGVSLWRAQGADSAFVSWIDDTFGLGRGEKKKETQIGLQVRNVRMH